MTGKSASTLAVEINLHEIANQSGKWKAIGGVCSDDWNHQIAQQVANSLYLGGTDQAERNRMTAGAIAAVIEVRPQDSLEGMAAAQLVAAHSAAMECYRRAMAQGQTFEGRKEALSQANRLSRTWSVLLDALNKHRGKRQQKVTVEHVHVHEGGQAVVGTIESHQGGKNKTKDRPHAKEQFNAFADAPKPAMQGMNTAKGNIKAT